MKPTIYHAPRTRSIRLVWLAEEMGLDCEVKTLPFSREYFQSDEWRAVNPLGKVPAFRDGDLTLIESVAIMEYMTAKYGPTELAPAADDPQYGPYLQWLHFGEAGMAPYVTMVMGHTHLLPEKARIPAMAEWGRREAKACFELLAKGLGDKDYLIGDFSAADISVVYMLYLAKLSRMGKDFPDALTAYFKRATDRPAWEKASKLGIE